jgi:hypothetical protein
VDTADGRYYSVDNEVQASGGRPIQPRLSIDIAEPGTRARGVLFLGGAHRSITSFDPVIARPVTDTAQTEPPFTLQGWYPAQIGVVNRIETASDSLERLVLVPGQFQNPGTERLWDRLTYDIYYSTDADTVEPQIWQVEATQLPSRTSFRVAATDPSGIERAVVAFSLSDGVWDSADLTYDPVDETWSGAVAVDEGDQMHYFVQVLDRAGNAARSDNKGFLFEPVMHKAYLPLVARRH